MATETCTTESNKKEEKDEQKEKEEEEEEEEVDLVKMLTKRSASKLNMKEMPPANKRGKVNYFGYMDDYFRERPPVPAVNFVIDNITLQIVRDLLGAF
jgi:hypothetical protein